MSKREQELLKRIEELERKVKELEARTNTEIHHHWPTYTPQYSPSYPYYIPPPTPWVPWYSSSTCASGGAIGAGNQIGNGPTL